MCGIIGYLSNSLSKELFEKQIKTLSHRGPDDNGIWISENKRVALGSVRLAIQDISPLGKMPMHDEKNQVHIVLNGEIYNFREIRAELELIGYTFISNSDTEVLLKSYLEWGSLCLDKLNGMFAFAIYDERTHKMLLARDRVGEKPLYIWNGGGQISFASELKAFFVDPSFPKKINNQALSEYLQYGYISSEQSIFENVSQLKPGHYFEIDTQTLKSTYLPYWSLLESKSSAHTTSEIVEKLEGLIEKSISHQLIADVPVGVFLSGGVDSSLITAIASKVSSKPIKTFHISMPDAPHLDERKYADQVAHYFSTEHVVLKADTINFDDFVSIIETLDEPMADSSYIPTFIVSKLARQYVTVVLGGDGGDELFAGYTHYQHLVQLQQKKGNFYDVLPQSLISQFPLGLRGRNFILSQKKENFKHGYKSFFDDVSLKKLISKSHSHIITPFSKQSIINFKENIIDSASQFDAHNYLPDDIMTKVDRASMANSLETRAPFLDRDILEFASTVPSSIKIKDNIKKYPLKVLLNQLMPNFEIERKQGFSIPLSQWVQTKWKAQIINLVNDIEVEAFDKKYLIALIEKEGKWFQNSNRIYALLVLLIWKRKYNIVF
jgi:asparagine synthase (glutamine-hydrolysing)